MTPMRQDLAARRRGELTRDRGSRPLSSAIDAQRRLNTGRADGPRTKADPVGPNDRRYAHLTRSYDGEGMGKRLAKRGDGSVEDGKNESEFYREIVRRANVARERATESLRLSRRRRETQGDLGSAV
jgi:hypothetical protein